MEKVYITGHKNPDLDSVIGAIAYAHLKQALDASTQYVASAVGELNAETKYVLERFSLPAPEHLKTVAGKKVILVDHNEKEQAVDDLGEASILEVIDHHQMNFSYSEPIRIIIEPLGSSSTVIAKMFKADDIEIPPNLAGAMLAAVLVDTVITKSPTSTDEDLKIIEELAETAGISDWRDFGMEVFKVRSSVSSLSDKEILTADYKDFDVSGRKVGIGQVETVDPSEFNARIDSLLKNLEEKRKTQGYHSVLLFITDIMKEESLFLVASEEGGRIAEAFDSKLEENNTFRAKVLSRKKEVVPTLLNKFK